MSFLGYKIPCNGMVFECVEVKENDKGKLNTWRAACAGDCGCTVEFSVYGWYFPFASAASMKQRGFMKRFCFACWKEGARPVPLAERYFEIFAFQFKNAIEQLDFPKAVEILESVVEDGPIAFSEMAPPSLKAKAVEIFSELQNDHQLKRRNITEKVLTHGRKAGAWSMTRNRWHMPHQTLPPDIKAIKRVEHGERTIRHILFLYDAMTAKEISAEVSRLNDAGALFKPEQRIFALESQNADKIAKAVDEVAAAMQRQGILSRSGTGQSVKWSLKL